MKRNICKKLVSIYLVTSFCFLSACGGKEVLPEPSGTQEDSAKQEAAEEKPLVTEEDYREAIASAADDAKKLELYREFASGYRLKEDEYIEYAGLCEKADDTAGQREVLFNLYRIDPTEEHGQLLSDMTLKITGDDKIESLLNDMVAELKNCEADDFSPEGLRGLIASDDWKKTFYIDNGTFTSNTEYNGDGITAVVSSDTLATRAVITAGDIRYLCELNYDGTNVGHVEAKDGASSGRYYYRQLDADDVDIISVNGYINEGHYVNQTDFTVGSTVYHGSFDDAGHTKEEQPEGFEGVVYAYTDDKANYLYVENADASNWVANVADMGLGEF